MPVCTAQNVSIREFNPEKTVALGASGFINPAYNYELLIATLERLSFDWQFIWIGGLRRTEDNKILHWLHKQIDNRDWNDRFRISGWVPQEEYDRLFADIDIICAFFSSRSSSQSLMDAIAYNKLIIATRLPVTEDLAGTESLCIITDPDADKAAGRITEITTDATVRRMLLHGITNYAEKCSYDNCARRLMNLYREVVAL
jgi:glycosyltransferase involved in cell wall biosynthesis